MSRLVRSRPSPALVISLIALFVSLGGTGFAALTVTGKNVRNGSLTGDDIRSGSLGERNVKDGSLDGNELRRDTLGGRQVKESSLGKVRSAKTADTVRSADSAKTAQTAQTAGNSAALGGASADSYARRLFAVVDGVSATPVVTRGSGGVSVARVGADGSGEYTVRFPQNVSGCAYSVTAGDAGNGDQFVRFFTDASKDEGNPNAVDVAANDFAEDRDNDASFSLIVIC